MGQAEGNIQRYVLDRLSLLERTKPVFYFRSNSFTGRVMRYDGSQGFIKNSKPGLPDIVALIAGKFVGFEIKTPQGRQSPEQKLVQQTIEGCGGDYYIVRSPEDFEEILKELL